MDPPSPAKITPVILCGGSGTRLWPLSRAALPKQLLDLTGGATMLALTAARVEDAALFEKAIVVAAEDQADAIEAQLADIGTLVLEPCARNTAPAIALAAQATAPASVLLVLPSDHLIRDTAAFTEALARGLPFARDGWIVTFGMKAERAETGYGYIERGAALADGVYAAKRFVEKPDAAAAAGFVAGGAHDWNAGIFLMTAETYLAELAAHAPEIARNVREAKFTRRGARAYPDPHWFGLSPARSIDYAVMEKAEKVALVPLSAGWSDIGSFAALHEVSEQDAEGNAVAGPGLAIDAKGCLIRSDGPMVVAIGVEDLVIVATRDAVLVVPREQSQRVKEAVDALKAQGKGDLT